MADERDEQFRAFVAARSTALLRTAYLLTGDHGHAEDAVQAILVRVHLAWRRIEHAGAAESYARTTLLREVLSWRRRRRVALVLTDRLPEVAGPEGVSAEPRDEVHTALLALPDRQRATVVLRYFDDLSEAQTADLLGVSVGTVKQHTSRALARLRDLLDDAVKEKP